MFSKLGQRLTYANIVSTLALFLVLSGGTAVALTGSNTVFSDDIKDGEVKRSDVAGGAIAGGKVVDDSLTGDDVAGLTGGDVNDNSLTGEDMNEASLGRVPSAQSAQTANSAASATNASTLDGLNSTDFALGDDTNLGTPYVQTGLFLLGANSSSSNVKDFGRFRMEATGTQDQFRVCNENNVSQAFVVYTGGASTSTDSSRQQFDVATNTCSAGISTGNAKGDFQVFGIDAVVFAHASAGSTYRYQAIGR